MIKRTAVLIISIIFIVLSLTAVNFYHIGIAENSQKQITGSVNITALKVGYFGISKATNISYKSNLSTNSTFKILMDISGNITRVYFTTFGFGIFNWTYSGGVLTVIGETPSYNYTGIAALHIVGDVPFSLIY